MDPLDCPVAGVDAEQVGFLPVDDPDGAQADGHTGNPVLDGHGWMDEAMCAERDALHRLVVPAPEPEIPLAHVHLAGATERELIHDGPGRADDTERPLCDLRRGGGAAGHAERDGSGGRSREHQDCCGPSVAPSRDPADGALEPGNRPPLRPPVRRQDLDRRHRLCEPLHALDPPLAVLDPVDRARKLKHRLGRQNLAGPGQ